VINVNEDDERHVETRLIHDDLTEFEESLIEDNDSGTSEIMEAEIKKEQAIKPQV
jgi:hypothetical protein